MSTTTRCGRRFFGWYVLAAAFAILFLVQGSRAIIGVTFKPIVAEFGWSRAAVSMAVFLNMTVLALTLTLVGRYYDRYGARRVITVSTLLTSAGFVGIAVTDRLWQFLLFFGVVAATGFAGNSIPLFAALTSRWFHRHRGFAVSLALGGGCLGHGVVVLLSNELVIGFDWRWAYLTCALLALAVNLALVRWVIRERPQDMGLTPYGETPVRDGATGFGAAVRENAACRDLTLSEAMGTRSFWLFTVVMMVCGGGDYLVLTHLVALVTDHGVSQRTAGNMLAWYGIFSLLGVLAAGRATDRIGNKIPIALTFLLRFLLFLMVLRFQSPSAFYLFALGFGFSHLVTAPITTTLVGKLYGFTHIGLITGVITTVHHLSGGVWAYAAGLVFDRTGSYRPVFAGYAAAALLALVCAVLIEEKRYTPPASRRPAIDRAL